MDWKIKAQQLHQEKAEWSTIYETIISEYFPDIKNYKERKTIEDRIRSYIRRLPEYEAKHETKQKIIGVIPDLHAPFIHPNFIDFLKDTFKEHKVTDYVFIGDIVDLHAVSRHMTEPSAKGAHQEYVMAYEALRPYVKAFPKAKMCKGNHDNIVERQIATLGMPPVFMKNFKELWGLPDTWDIDSQFIIDDVFYHHGLGAGGINGAINKALNERMSVVQGHQHSVFNIEYRANARDIIFGMSVGCGIDNTAYSFEYGKYMARKPVMGCGIVVSSNEAKLVPMGSQYFRGQ